ncbi:MAG: EamA family transporter [Dokdonella sp.]
MPSAQNCAGYLKYPALMTRQSPSRLRTRRRATAYGVAAIVLWSSLALMTLVTANMPPFQVLSIAFAIGGACGLLLSLLRGSAGLRELRQPWPAFFLAVVALFGYHALYLFAFRHAPAVEVNLVNYSWPLLIVLFAMALPEEKVRGAQLLGALLGLSGVVVMVTRGQGISVAPVHASGYLAALLAALTWAAYSVLNRRFQSVPSAAVAVSCLAVAALAALAHVLLETTVMPSSQQIMVLVAMGLGPVGIAFRWWDIGTKNGDIAVLGTLSYAAPLLSTLILLLSGRAGAHVTQAIAVGLLMLGAAISVRAAQRE